jgi:flagellar motor switch protein FliG
MGEQIMSHEGVNKSAILLMSLGESEAAQVLKFLEPKEVQKISTAMVALRNLSREQIAEVVEEFHDDAAEKTTIGMDSSAYIRNMLTQALGSHKAAGLLDRILHNNDTTGIESLKWMEPHAIVDLIQGEHPQIIATILVHLEPDQSSSILNLLSERLRNDVMLRIATLDGVQPVALHELNEVFTQMLSGAASKKFTRGGIKTAAEILNFVGTANEATVIENVRAVDPDLAQKIQDQMFVFENLLTVEDRAIQLILREIQTESLIVALKGASEEIREKIFKNMSQRAGEMLREDLEAKGPVKVTEVEAEQKAILKVARRLSDEGQISLGPKGEEAYV